MIFGKRRKAISKSEKKANILLTAVFRIELYLVSY